MEMERTGEVNKRYSGSKTKKKNILHHSRVDKIIVLFSLHVFFSLRYMKLIPGDKQKLRHLATSCGHLEMVLSGGDNAILKSQSPSPFKSTDMPGACLLISFVFWRLQQNTLCWIFGRLTDFRTNRSLHRSLGIFKTSQIFHIFNNIFPRTQRLE